MATVETGGGFFTWPSLPALDISPSGNCVMVSWPDYAVACALQQSGALSPPNWVNSPDAVSDGGTNRFILEGPSSWGPILS